MKTKTPTCCNRDTFSSEEEARARLDRLRERGVRRVLPMDVEPCMRGWHLVFPPEVKEHKPRKPLARTRMKDSKPKGVPEAAKAIIRRRANGLCEVGIVCRGAARGVDPAHREAKGTGGTGKDWSNLPSNLQWACRTDHDWIDRKQPAKAELFGYKVRSGVARPWEIPVKHARLGWVLLDDDGGHRSAPEGSHADGRRPTPVVACTAWELIQQSGAFAEAMQRYGHIDCPGWSAPRIGPFTCGCGSTPFLVIGVS